MLIITEQLRDELSLFIHNVGSQYNLPYAVVHKLLMGLQSLEQQPATDAPDDSGRRSAPGSRTFAQEMSKPILPEQTG